MLKAVFSPIGTKPTVINKEGDTVIGIPLSPSSTGEDNIIDTIDVNGINIPPIGKNVSITVPTNTSDLINDSDFVVDANYVHTANNFTDALKTKLDGIEDEAEVNQNSFSNITVGGDTISADTKTDTFELIAGTNITLVANVPSDTITINSSFVENDTVACIAVRELDLVADDGDEELIVFNPALSTNTTGLFVNVSGEIECAEDGFYQSTSTVYVTETGNPSVSLWIEYKPFGGVYEIAPNSLNKFVVRDDGSSSIPISLTGNLFAGDTIRFVVKPNGGDITLETTTESTALGTVTQHAMTCTVWRIGKVIV